MKLFVQLSLVFAMGAASAQGLPAPTPIGEIQPSPPSIGSDIPATCFGLPPSAVQKELIGPYQLLKSGVVDQTRGTIKLPIYKGQL